MLISSCKRQIYRFHVATQKESSITPRIAIIGLVSLSVAVGVQPVDAQGNRLYAGVSGMWSTQGSTRPGQSNV
jgi:hypothetical protein